MADTETIDNVIPINRSRDRKRDGKVDTGTAPIFDSIIDANRRKEERLAAERLKENEKTLSFFKIKRRSPK